MYNYLYKLYIMYTSIACRLENYRIRYYNRYILKQQGVTAKCISKGAIKTFVT